MAAPRDTGRLEVPNRGRRPAPVPIPEDTTRRGDWPAVSELWERMGGRRSQGGPTPDPFVMYAVAIFGTGPCLRPTWTNVARREQSMGTHRPWFTYKWSRLARQRAAERRYKGYA